MTPMFDDETLMRRVDGELTLEVAEAIDAAAATDPALTARLTALRALRSAARAAFPLAADPRDAVLTRLIAAGAATRARQNWFGSLGEMFLPRYALAWGGAAAVCFVAGLVAGQIGGQIGGRPDGFAVGRDGAIADAGLIKVLDRGLAADRVDARGRAVDLTFRDDAGRWCRTFRAGEAGVAGLACRQDGRWAMQALAPFTAPTGELRTAAAETPAAVLAAVDAAGGDTLDAAAETRARNAGWR